MTYVAGMYTVMITPFDENGKIDEQGFRHNIQFQLKHKIDGIVILGTTGEAPTLTSKEKERIIRIAVEEAKGKVPIVVGTGSYSTQQTIESTNQAEQLGADLALIIAPYYNK